MNYKRVNPRDLFNESKLLKCIGRICLAVLDGEINGLNVDHENAGLGYAIVQDPLTGDINVANVTFYDNNGTPVYFSTSLNAKDHWPLEMEYKGKIYYPINEDGKYQLDKNLFKGV